MGRGRRRRWSPRALPSTVPERSAYAWVKRLWPFARRNAGYVRVLMAAMFLEAPLTLAMPLILRHVVDGALASPDRAQVLYWAVVLGAITLASALLKTVIGYCTTLFRTKVYHRLRLRLYTHLQTLSASYFAQRETGSLMSRQLDDVSRLGGAMADTFGRGTIAALKAVTCAGMLFYVQWRLALGGVMLALLVFGFQYAVSPALRRRSRRAREAWTDLAERLHQVISGHPLIRASAAERREARGFAGLLHSSVRANLDVDLFGLFTGTVQGLVLALMPSLIILGGVLLILGGDFTVGGLFAFYIYLQLMFESVGTLTGLNPALQVAVASLERIFEVLDTRPDVEAALESAPTPRLSGEVVFDGVSFAYEPGREVLRGIDFRAAPRTMVALVGPSGAGKTTLAHLVPRFYDPTAGRVLVDGRDVRTLDLRTYRRQVGIVPQEIFLFDRTLAENVAYGRPGASMEEIRRAAAAANALDFIEGLEQGFETVVGERGVRLSGGQRQRIAIAREILRDPAILILDEATSSLDSTSERLIQEALDKLLAGRTSLVIAHRLSTILKADVILVLNKGRIVEQGKHFELVDRGGLYSRLFRAQFEHLAAPEDDEPEDDLAGGPPPEARGDGEDYSLRRARIGSVRVARRAGK